MLTRLGLTEWTLQPRAAKGTESEAEAAQAMANSGKGRMWECHPEPASFENFLVRDVLLRDDGSIMKFKTSKQHTG